MGKHARLGIVLLVFWTAFVVYRTAGDHELFGLELDRWSDDAFLVNLLALPAAIVVLVFSIRWALESGVALRDMNWKRGLKRLWLLAAIPWMIYAFGEYDAPREIGNAWRYYTYYEAPNQQQSTTTSNTYLDLLKQDEARQTGAARVGAATDSLDVAMDDHFIRQTRAGAAVAIDSNPDDLARQKRIAKSLDVPLATVQADPAFAIRKISPNSMAPSDDHFEEGAEYVARAKFTDAAFTKLAQGHTRTQFRLGNPRAFVSYCGRCFCCAHVMACLSCTALGMARLSFLGD